MKTMPVAGTLVRFAENGNTVEHAEAAGLPTHVGYVTTIHPGDCMRVCTKPGTYWTVDRALAEVV